MEGKKISFGFSKTKPKGSSLIQQPKVEEKVEFITSFDKHEKKPEAELPPELVIPVKTNFTVAERIIAKKRKQEEENSLDDSSDKKIVSEGSSTEEQMAEDTSVKPAEPVPSLEQLAIQELLDNSKNTTQKDQPTLSIPLSNDLEQEGPASNSVDYDSVPVSQFGYAMLRGMGWAPGKGIGKKQKVVEVVDLTLRPRSLGLGAEYVPDRHKTDSKETKKPTREE